MAAVYKPVLSTGGILKKSKRYMTQSKVSNKRKVNKIVTVQCVVLTKIVAVFMKQTELMLVVFMKQPNNFNADTLS